MTKPKIIQVFTDMPGTPMGVLYNDGRVFLWHWTKKPDEYDKNPLGKGYWSEMIYPTVTAGSSGETKN
jgi:hypothetical protein